MRMELSHLATLHLLCVPFLPSLYRPRRVMPETTNNTCFCLPVLPTLFSRLARMEPRAFAGKPSVKQVKTQWQARGKNQWVEAHTVSCHIGRPSSAAASATPSGCAGGNNNSARLRTTSAAPPPCALPCCTWHGFAATAAATGMPVQIRCPSLQQLRRHVCRLAGRGVGCAGRQQRLALRHVLDDVILSKGWGEWVGGWVAGLVAWSGKAWWQRRRCGIDSSIIQPRRQQPSLAHLHIRVLHVHCGRSEREQGWWQSLSSGRTNHGGAVWRHLTHYLQQPPCAAVLGSCFAPVQQCLTRCLRCSPSPPSSEWMMVRIGSICTTVPYSTGARSSKGRGGGAGSAGMPATCLSAPATLWRSCERWTAARKPLPAISTASSPPQLAHYPPAGAPHPPPQTGGQSTAGHRVAQERMIRHQSRQDGSRRQDSKKSIRRQAALKPSQLSRAAQQGAGWITAGRRPQNVVLRIHPPGRWRRRHS